MKISTLREYFKDVEFAVEFTVFLMVVSCLLTFAGGAIGAKLNPHHNSEISQFKAPYEACLTQHPDDIKACEGFRLLYEADRKFYQELARGFPSDTKDTMNTHSAASH